MLRKLSATLFSNTKQARPICLKQCSTENKPENAHESQLESRLNSIGPTLILAFILNPPEFKNMMFPKIFHAPVEKIPTLYDILRKTDDFDLLIEKLPASKKQALADALCNDMSTLQKMLVPLSAKCQQQTLEFIGWQRIVALGHADSLLSKESPELEFFAISEVLNNALRRENYNYLYKMKDRDSVNIAAKPGMGEK